MIRALLWAYREAYSGLPRAVWVLAITLFINRAGNMVLPFVALYLTSAMHASPSQVTLALSAHGVGAMLGANLGGRLCRVFNYHLIQVGSLLLSGLGLLALLRVTTPEGVALSFLWISTMSEAFRPANGAAVTSACSAQDRARAMALVRMAVNLGMTVAPAIGGLLVGIDYSWIFWVDGGTCLLAALFLMATPYHKQAGGRPSSSQSTSHSPWKDKKMWLLIGLSYPTMLIFFQLLTTWPLYLTQERGFSEFQFGLFMALSTLLIVVFEMLLAHKLATARHWKVIAVGALLVGLGLGVMPLAGSGFTLALTVFVWTFGEMLFVPFLSSEVANLSDDDNRGAYMGLYTFSFATAWVVAPIIGMAIYSHWGGQILWPMCGLTAIFQFLAFQMCSNWYSNAVSKSGQAVFPK
ncbi:MAG: MFS transporter [Acidobacteria bacterium]|nr:MFS transporter [Acidobacteriota bacterium]